jgi:GT2 family glycosyltransferase
MKISVIVPVFNVGPYLEGFLDAVLTQEYAGAYEVICVDNGSTDGSLEILQARDGVTVLREAKRGSYAARNCGIRAACGALLAFVDPDCPPRKRWLAAIGKAFEEPGCHVALGKREYGQPSRALRRLSDYDITVAGYVFSSSTPEIYFGYTNNMAVRRSLFDQVGLFREIQRGADTVFVRRTVAALGCGAVVYAPEMCVCHQEIRHVADFYKKRIIYGESNSRTRNLGSARPLRLRERIRIFQQTVRDCDYSLVGAAELLGLLGLGVLCYEFGRWRGRLFSGSLPGEAAAPDASES